MQPARPILPSASILLALTALAAPVQAQICTPARMMIVLDRSASMSETIPNTNQTKWAAAQSAVGGLATKFESSIDLGLMIFPGPAYQCSTGTVLVTPAPLQAAKIKAQLTTGPTAHSWTPIATSIDAAAAAPSMQDPARRPALILVTDGWQWCSPYDEATRFYPVAAVKRAKAKGILTYVVGFGDGIDVLTLNKMAATGGTAFPNCDPAGADVNSPNKCYFQTGNQAQLDAALDSIAVKVSTEVCDNLDNNCDGQIDEHLTRACLTDCGRGIEACDKGTWKNCDAPLPEAEMCDNKDNNCDGIIDEGCACVPGDSRRCGSIIGACRRGQQDCGELGVWTRDCAGEVKPKAETCNGEDDDCDGRIDEADELLLCPDGESCRNGKCEKDPIPDAGPAPEPTDAGDAGLPVTGCGCRTGGNESMPVWPLFLIPLAALMGIRLGRRLG